MLPLSAFSAPIDDSSLVEFASDLIVKRTEFTTRLLQMLSEKQILVF